MQCTRCAKTLPESVSFCLACGFPVNASGGAKTGAAPMAGGANTGTSFAQTPTNGADQQGPGTAQAGFAFQEFGSGPSGSAGRPTFAPPGNAPSSPYPSQPGRQSAYPPPVVPGQMPPGAFPSLPGTGPYPFQPGAYPPPFMPVAAPPKPKRRGRSVGCIVLYILLAFTLLFAGLGVALYTIIFRASESYAATRTAAMQLYQQVTSQPPTIQDLLAGDATSNWSMYQEAMYSCGLDNAALSVSTSATGKFGYCIDNTVFSTDIAFQAQMQIVSGNAGGLVFRVTPAADGSAYGFYLFQVNRQGDYAIYLHKTLATNDVSRLTTGITQAMDAQAGQTNTVTVIAKGNVSDLYINQQFVTQIQDGTLNGAMVGVAASDATLPTTVLYSNIKLWGLAK